MLITYKHIFMSYLIKYETLTVPLPLSMLSIDTNGGLDMIIAKTLCINFEKKILEEQMH